MLNSAQDNNVLTKCDKESNLPINFQPIPKRFMVWDTKYEKFLTVPMEIWQIVIHFRNRYHQLYDDSGNSRYVFCQSTNLFDEDGEEIFEGSIVPWNEDTGVVEWRNGKWVLPVTTSAFSVYHELGPNADMVKVIGHVLSNPELLEEA